MTALLILGMILTVVGGIWLLVVAFQTSVWWGLGSLLIPFVGLVFVFMHWQPSKKPFLIYVVGFVLLAIGAMNSPQWRAAMPV
jgi:hypothetical protein